MRIGLIVDGQAELYALPQITQRLGTPHVVLPPLRADIQPTSTASQIARAVKTPLRILFDTRRVDRAVIVLDHESRTECPGIWATTLMATVHGQFGPRDIVVVVKNRTFENWLVADVEAVKAIAGRFKLSKAIAKSISTGNADSTNGLRVLRDAAHGAPYQRVNDAVRILSKARPEEIARCSRSFRKFLRVLGHPKFKTQSAVPV